MLITLTAQQLVIMRPGEGVGIVNDRVRVLIGADSTAVAGDLWSGFLDQQSLTGVLDLLARDGLASLGSFAVAIEEADTRVRLLVRGSGRAVAQVDGNDSLIEPQHKQTWAEQVIEQPSLVGLWLDPSPRPPGSLGDEGVGLVRLLSGIAPASAMWWTSEQQTTPGDMEPSQQRARRGSPPPASPAPTPVVNESSAEKKRSALAARRGSPAAAVAVETQTGTPADDVKPQPPADGDPVAESPSHEPSSGNGETPAADESGHSATGDAPDGGDESGATQLPSADLGGSDGLGIEVGAPKPVQGVIDSVPKATTQRDSTAVAGGPQFVPKAKVTPPGDHTRIVSPSPESSRPTSKPTAPPSENGSPETNVKTHVQASMCVRRHPNPAYAVRCGTCGDQLGDSIEWVPRPRLGTLLFSDGRRVELETTLVIGTDPIAPSEVADEPHAIISFAESPSVARTHLMVRIDGWHAYVVDLNSAMGTELTLPGRPAIRLRPSDETLLEPGSRVQIGPDVHAEYESPF